MLLARINAWLLSALLVIAPVAANASQGNLFSATTGTVSGLQLTNNYNAGLDALNTCNSGATAPTNQLSGTPSLGNCWLNSTSSPFPWQLYDGSNWLTPFWIDQANHVTNVKIGGGVATVASAATVDLCASSGNVAPRAYITITGTTGITSFGSTCNAGHVKIVTFSGSLTLTYNAASMIIPGAANVQTSAGDQAILMALGSGNWQVLAYTPASGQALINPAIDVGDYLFTSAVSVPSSKYLLAYGQAISRTTYASYLAAVTITQSVTATNGSPTLTGFSDTTQIAAGSAIEATFIPNGVTITSCTSTTCVMSGNATTSTTGNVTIFPYGNGCGFGTSCASPSTSFNMPDCRDVAFVGRGNMGGTARSDNYQLTSTYFGASPNALGVFGGAQSTTLATINLPAYTPSGSVSSSSSTTGTVAQQGFAQFGSQVSSGASLGSNNGGLNQQSWLTLSTTTTSTFAGSPQGGSSTPFSRVQPTQTANCMVRVLAMRRDVPLQKFAANENAPAPVALTDRRRLAA